jgi:hypothetical protein
MLTTDPISLLGKMKDGFFVARKGKLKNTIFLLIQSITHV